MSKIKTFKFTIDGWPVSFYRFDAFNNILMYSYKDEDDKLKSAKYDIQNDFYENVETITKDWLGKYEHNNMIMLDGESWKLDITYEDGNKKLVSGINAYPENYDELINYLESIVTKD